MISPYWNTGALIPDSVALGLKARGRTEVFKILFLCSHQQSPGNLIRHFVQPSFILPAVPGSGSRSGCHTLSGTGVLLNLCIGGLSSLVTSKVLITTLQDPLTQQQTLLSKLHEGSCQASPAGHGVPVWAMSRQMADSQHRERVCHLSEQSLEHCA